MSVKLSEAVSHVHNVHSYKLVLEIFVIPIFEDFENCIRLLMVFDYSLLVCSNTPRHSNTRGYSKTHEHAIDYSWIYFCVKVYGRSRA